MENQHSTRHRVARGAFVFALALTACHGAEPVVPGEPDPAAWAALAVGDGDGDVTFFDRGPEDIIDADVPASDATVSGLCSASGPATTWHLINARRSPVTLWWVDFNCNEARYADVEPGATYSQGTFVTHVWRVRDTADNRLITEVVLDMAPMQSTEVR